jgi:hypothetical protein
MRRSGRSGEVGGESLTNFPVGPRRGEIRRFPLTFPPQLDSSLLQILGVEAELLGYPEGLRVTSLDGEGARPGLGFLMDSVETS